MILQICIGLSVAYALMTLATYVIALYLLHTEQLKAKTWMLIVMSLLWPLVWFVPDETRKRWSDRAQKLKRSRLSQAETAAIASHACSLLTGNRETAHRLYMERHRTKLHQLWDKLNA